MDNTLLSRSVLAEDVRKTLESAASIIIPQDREQMLDLTFRGEKESFEVGYEVPGKGFYVEATVDKCKNGASVNYTEAYMR